MRANIPPHPPDRAVTDADPLTAETPGPAGALSGHVVREGVDTSRAWVSELPAELVTAVERFQAGERSEAHFAIVYRYYARRIHGYFLRKRIPPHASADLSQEVWLRVLNGLAGFRWEAPLGAWIFAIAYNVYLRHLESTAPRARDVAIEPDTLSDDADVLRSLIDAELRARIFAAIDVMPPNMRTCMQLRYVQGLSYKDIARVMRVAIETVAAHIHQGKDRLIEVVAPAT